MFIFIFFDHEMGDLKEKKLKNAGHLNFAMLNDEILENVAFDTARQFFTICDRDSKGYLLKGDMQRLRESGLCNLSIEELEMVFDSLDEDHNGILTMEEFIFGFGEFVKSTHPEMVELTENEGEQASNQQLQCITNTDEDVVEREKFQTFLRQIGAEDLFSDENTEQLWQILRNDNPNVLNKFEAFLKNLSSEMKSVRDKMCATTQGKREDLNRLYTDVEQQIKQETERCLKNEKDALAEQKQNLEMQLCKQKDESEELMKYLNKVQKEIREERKRRAKAALTNMSQAASLSASPCASTSHLRPLRETTALSSPMLATTADYRTSFNCRSRFLIDSDADDLESIHSELLQADSGISGLDNFENGQDSIEPINIGTPDRVFKVVVAGDSGVGKTCFLDRLCNNRFNPGIRSTIGIDFHMKILKVEDQLIALQLWDTAGQERMVKVCISKQAPNPVILSTRRCISLPLLKDVSSRRDEKLICLQKTSDKPKSKCCSRTNV
ncbi:EF-hand calcium-binding domain-containing protein 4B [Trichinella papuae]|uniref:EF-hand calcium-binding domain-containing protein 4B n=1 Tax=Trichinella papuae TaxID=268474 RepID=A0A0V1N8W4_9BILA|nr:EF-hand calcium-binding domain-containing protein 4B [Trichinella papuae]